MKTMKEYLSSAKGMEQMWDKINEVLDAFNFSKVKAVMEALDWHWVCTDEEAEMYEEEGCRIKRSEITGDAIGYYPEPKQMYMWARQLILDTIKDMPDEETRWASSTGGFKAEVWINEPVAGPEDGDFSEDVDIALYFIAEESESY